MWWAFLQVTSAPCGLFFKTLAQLGSSFFSFVNYFSLLPGAAGVCLARSGCSGLATLPPDPLPAQPSPSCCRLLPPCGEAAEAQESWQAGAQQARVVLRKRLQMRTRRRRRRRGRGQRGARLQAWGGGCWAAASVVPVRGSRPAFAGRLAMAPAEARAPWWGRASCPGCRPEDPWLSGSCPLLASSRSSAPSGCPHLLGCFVSPGTVGPGEEGGARTVGRLDSEVSRGHLQGGKFSLRPGRSAQSREGCRTWEDPQRGRGSPKSPWGLD